VLHDTTRPHCRSAKATSHSRERAGCRSRKEQDPRSRTRRQDAARGARYAFTFATILGGKTGGTFVDVGAYDGVTGSNSLYFEKWRGWSGVLVEPVPAHRETAETMRAAPCLPYAIAANNGSAPFLSVTKGYLQMSGLLDSYDDAMLERVRENPHHAEDTIEVETRTLSHILTDAGLINPDFISLDIEGGELSVLESFPFEKHKVLVWSIENNSGSPEIPKIMRANLSRLHHKPFVGWHGTDDDDMTTDAIAPIIIKRKKVVGGDGHHGGAWKVAYADFVTAMMAFFMLMWLLNATTEQQRSGLADYFTPTIAINRVSGGGDGALSGDSVMATEALPQSGNGGIGDGQGNGLTDALQAIEAAALRQIEEQLFGSGGESMLSQNALKHVVTRVTDEGLVIEVFDRPEATLFYPDTDRPTPIFEEIAEIFARLLSEVENDIAVSGYVQSQSILRVENTEWTLSTDRATRVRIMLENNDYPDDKITRLTGWSDRKPAVADTSDVRNNRIEVTVLRMNKL